MFKRELVCSHEAWCEGKVSYFSKGLKQSPYMFVFICSLACIFNLDMDHLLRALSYCLDVILETGSYQIFEDDNYVLILFLFLLFFYINTTKLRQTVATFSHSGA